MPAAAPARVPLPQPLPLPPSNCRCPASPSLLFRSLESYGGRFEVLPNGRKRLVFMSSYTSKVKENERGNVARRAPEPEGCWG